MVINFKIFLLISNYIYSTLLKLIIETIYRTEKRERMHEESKGLRWSLEGWQVTLHLKECTDKDLPPSACLIFFPSPTYSYQCHFCSSTTFSPRKLVLIQKFSKFLNCAKSRNVINSGWLISVDTKCVLGHWLPRFHSNK